MSAGHTLKNLNDVKDSAPGFGHGDVQEARFANDDLETEQTGVSLLRVKPGCRQAFAHRHDDAEEVYVVTSGSGRIKLDDEILEISELDAIRIAPGVVRQLEAGEDGLEYIAAGPRHEGDGELLPGWWSD
jgi:mannose-6-phosphate isomerase-like protein (cupin superfamily)